MDALASAYDSDDASSPSEKEGETSGLNFEESASMLQAIKEKYNTDSAPRVADKVTVKNVARVDPKTNQLMYNPTYDELYIPKVGPENPNKTRQQKAPKNMLSGYVEQAHVNNFDFDNQRRTFHIMGYAVDPSTVDKPSTDKPKIIGDMEKAEKQDSASIVELPSKKRIGAKRKRLDRGDPSDVDGYLGPWAGYVDEKKVAKPTEEEMSVLEEKFGSKKKAGEEEEIKDVETKTILHIDDPYDYQGRSYLHIPQDLDVNLRSDDPPLKCFIPKKCIHTWSAHNKGVAAIKYFPKSAHLLLSGGMDCKIKLWEVYNERRCIRTYIGHGKAVKDISFNHDGTNFVSAGYDRHIKLWDTETGECVRRFCNHKLPYCIQFHPGGHRKDYFLVGCSNKKIYAWDTRTGGIVQEYDRHLGAVNTITFVDKGRRFVTTSDDKSLRVWEWDTPVDMKYVAEPGMHSMPSVTLHPNGKWILCQSMDNQIVCFGVLNNFRMNRKKNFKGHMVAGYACQIDVSPEGSYVISGDAEGKLNVWDWKSTKLYSKFKAHDSVCIGCLWHPHETSKVITCGWDGLIKFWD